MKTSRKRELKIDEQAITVLATNGDWKDMFRNLQTRQRNSESNEELISAVTPIVFSALKKQQLRFQPHLLPSGHKFQ